MNKVEKQSKCGGKPFSGEFDGQLIAQNPAYRALCCAPDIALAPIVYEASEHNPFWMRRTFWIVLYVCLWIGSLIFGIAGAIPYGGGGAIQLWAALTWLFIIWLAFLIVRALLSPVFRSFLGKKTESDVDYGPAIGNRQSSEAMAMCKHCHTETPLTDPNCAWCGERLENEG